MTDPTEPRPVEERVARYFAAKDHPRTAWGALTGACREAYLADARELVAVVLPPADRAAERDRIAEALHRDQTPAPVLPWAEELPLDREYFLRRADAVLGVWPAPADRAADVCICEHTEPQHFEDACLVCGCGDYLPPVAAREVIARLQEAVKRKPTDRGAELTSAIYDALVGFQRTAQLSSLQHAQMRQYLAEHLAGALALRMGIEPTPETVRGATLRDFLWRLEQSAGDAAAEKFLDDNPELRRVAVEAQPFEADRDSSTSPKADSKTQPTTKPEPVSRQTLVDLVRDFRDPDPCSLDHHGYCQAHSWLCSGSPCPHGRAREVLAAIDAEPRRCPSCGHLSCDGNGPCGALLSVSALSEQRCPCTEQPVVVVSEPGKEKAELAALLNGCPAAHGALGRICELPKGHAGMHTGSGPNGGPVRCPLCPHTVTLHTPNGARAHFANVHPEQRMEGPGPWPLLANRVDPPAEAQPTTKAEPTAEPRETVHACPPADRAAGFPLPARTALITYAATTRTVTADGLLPLLDAHETEVRAAVLREATDIAEDVAIKRHDQHEIEREQGALDVMTQLRRMADEAQPTTQQ